MAYSVEWLEHPYIIEMIVGGELSEADSKELIRQWSVLMAEEPDTMIHTLFDLSELKTTSSMKALVAEVKQVVVVTKNRAPSTVYGLNKVTRFLIETLLRLTDIRLKMFGDREQALAFLHEMIEQEKSGY